MKPPTRLRTAVLLTVATTVALSVTACKPTTPVPINKTGVVAEQRCADAAGLGTPCGRQGMSLEVRFKGEDRWYSMEADDWVNCSPGKRYPDCAQ